MATKTTKTTKKELPEINPGDVLRVHQKIKEGAKERIQVFEGIVIKTHGKQNVGATFTVRKIASGVGVEKTYLLHSPNIVKIEFKKGSQVRRAKLYYLRGLSGKGLRMKEKKIDRDVWELVAGTEEEAIAEPSEEDIAEAVKADEEAKKAENETSEVIESATESQTTEEENK